MSGAPSHTRLFTKGKELNGAALKPGGSSHTCVLVVAAPGEGQAALLPYAKACAQQLRERGMFVELTEGRSIDRFHLFKAKTLVVIANKAGFFSGNVNVQPLHQALASAGELCGQQGYAILLRRGPFAQRALLRLMKSLESEGLLLLGSAVVNSIGAMKTQLRTWRFDN